MKTTTLIKFLTLGMLIAVGACKKSEEIQPASGQSNLTTFSSPGENDFGNGQQVCGTSTVQLTAGQNIDAGTVEISNTRDSIYVTYTALNGWAITETHLYVGPIALMPKTNTGNPKVGNFPYKNSFNPGTTQYQYAFAIASLNSCFDIAAHAVVSKQTSDTTWQTETAWAAGTALTVKGSWASYTSYCVEECPACVFTTESFPIYGGQTIENGALTVTNDATNLYITYTMNSGWYLGTTHLYVGELSGLPVNNASTPVPGQFPYNVDQDSLTSTYTYTIPLESLPSCYIIAAHAATYRVENGVQVQEETSWSFGTPFPNSTRWGWYSSYCTQVCE